MSTRRYLIAALAILMLGSALRVVWLRADPPIGAPGIVWDDEGAWTHNARNKALWGQWTTDKWNPLYIAPVFTALEYGAFRTFGVGLWQARTVPVASGVVAIVLLMAGLCALSGRRTALIGGALLATNYAWVMWNRAALMESTMIAFIVVAWAAYAMGSRRAAWGFVAGVAVALAWFTKASAAFFAAAIVADAVATIALARLPNLRTRLRMTEPARNDERTAWLTLAGLAVAGGVIGAVFVWPHWSDYWFYNVQMSVERKPAYALRDFQDRATWLPVANDFLSRMRLELVGAGIAMAGLLARWREARPAERLLVLWMFLGLLELTVHDSGDERYYMMLTPALVALAAMLAGSGASWLPARLASAPIGARVLALPFILVIGYLLAGTMVRAAFPDELSAGVYRSTVRISAGLSAVAALMLFVWWRHAVTWMAGMRISATAAAVLVAASAVWNLGLYGRWAANRSELNYQASVDLDGLLPPGTLVHGKLANGLALDNRIRPIFVGNGFGNYADRFDRDDARYILTYDLPEIGCESQRGSGLIPEILARYPNRQTVATFAVDEKCGVHRAVLIDKGPGAASEPVPGIPRARD
jgi:4-amino-4-deoxy-L-arabinose transferase-like glycosyltransferase